MTRGERMQALHRDAARYRALRAAGEVVAYVDITGDVLTLEVSNVIAEPGTEEWDLAERVRAGGGNCSTTPALIDLFADLLHRSTT